VRISTSIGKKKYSVSITRKWIATMMEMGLTKKEMKHVVGAPWVRGTYIHGGNQSRINTC
jgi:hypothetical protein